MVFDIIGTILKATISLCHISYKQVLHQTLGILIKISWELYFAFQDFLVNGHGVIVVEWIDSCNHFVGQNTQGPPIDWLSMSFIK